ncbi:PPE family protein [Mycobacterium sp.]|uniref:PPE family protein n=1 Tax=Mycobacterium sp. TaxID=1785 RepID=UPI0031DB91A6
MIFMAAPPEVHSTLLSSGPGPGSLLAAAGAWSALSAEYAQTAAELDALLAAVRAGTWDGPTSEAFVAAYQPYLAWLTQASADSAATAARHETAAAAYAGALAAMPTLPELAANHATHAALLATNFFGINTIPIALNEADYARMWVQAATVMDTYQAVSAAAVDSAPHTSPAPQIVKSDAAVANSRPGSNVVFNFFTWLDQLIDQLLGPKLTGPPYYVGEPFYDFASLANLKSIIAYILSPPANFTTGQPLNLLGATQSLLSLPGIYWSGYEGVAAAIGNNVPLLTFASAVYAIEVFFDFSTQLLQYAYFAATTTPLLPTVAALPVLAVPLAAVGGVAGLAGLAGLAQPAVVPVAPSTPALPVLGPPAVPVPTTMPATVATATPTPAPGTPVPPAPGAPSPPPAGPGPFPYLVGGLGVGVQKGAGEGAARKAPAPDAAAAAAAAAATQQRAGARRRRRPTAEQLGRGYEYMDLEPETEPQDNKPPNEQWFASAAPDRGSGTLGFAGTAHSKTAATAAGLARLGDDAFGSGPRIPMVPGALGVDSARPDSQ